MCAAVKVVAKAAAAVLISSVAKAIDQTGVGSCSIHHWIFAAPTNDQASVIGNRTSLFGARC
jgi:hypothetical protein